MAKYEIPIEIINKFGPFKEFKQDGSIVSVELNDGEIIN